MRPPSWEERDSFEMQTDRMKDVDACAELLKRVRAIREVIGTPHERSATVETEVTKDGYGKINQVTWDAPKQISVEELFKASFVAWRVLQEIEEMLSSDKQNFWRLHLKQRYPGKRTVPSAIAADIYGHYGDARCFEPETPIKAVIGRLAAEYDLPDTTIREIVRRKHGKKPKPRLKR